jgi:hypothetical protein
MTATHLCTVTAERPTWRAFGDIIHGLLLRWWLTLLLADSTADRPARDPPP